MQSRIHEIKEKKGKQVLNLNKLDLVTEYARLQDCSAATALNGVESVLISIQSMFASIIAEYPDLDIVQLTLSNFGRFDLKKVPEHTKRVNHLGTTIVIPEGYKLQFSHSEAWDSILKSK